MIWKGFAVGSTGYMPPAETSCSIRNASVTTRPTATPNTALNAWIIARNVPAINVRKQTVATGYLAFSPTPKCTTAYITTTWHTTTSRPGQNDASTTRTAPRPLTIGRDCNGVNN